MRTRPTGRDVGLLVGALCAVGALAFTSLQPVSAGSHTNRCSKPVSATSQALTGTYRVTTATVSYHGTTYALDTTQSALLITNGFDGGQTANLDGVTSYKGTSIPVAVVHSTGGCFPHDVEESAPGQFELGSPGSIREEGVGTIQLKRSGNDLEYRATVPTSGGPAVTIQASAVLASTHVTPR